MSTTQREDVSIRIDRAEYRGWTDVEIVRGIDSCSAVSFSAPFDVEDAATRERFRPFSFRGVDLLVNGDPLFDGLMVDVLPDESPSESKVGVSCYSRPAMLSEVNLPPSAFPLEFNGMTLSQIAERVCAPFGITVAGARAAAESAAEARARAARIAGARRRLRDAQEALTYAENAVSGGRPAAAAPADDPQRMRMQAVVADAAAALRHVSRQVSAGAPARVDGAPFDRVALEPEASPWTFLSELAKQRGVILSDTPLGELLIFRSTEGGSPVARLREGSHPLESVNAKFSPQGYFSEITGLGAARPGAAGSSYTERNPRLRGVVRPSTFKPDDTELADVPAAVRARMGRMFGNLATYELAVPTWRDPSGALWSPNTTITLLAPRAMVYRETEMLIREVTLRRTADSISASLSVVLPGAFSGGIPTRLPWDD